MTHWFEPQRGGMFIDTEQQRIPSSVRSDMENRSCRPDGAFLFPRCLL